MHALEREIACATEQEIMVDLMMSTTSAFSDRPSQPSCQSCRLALHPASAGLQRPHWLITLSKARRDGLSRFFDPLGETVRGPSSGSVPMQDRWTGIRGVPDITALTVALTYSCTVG